jgi:hypothetical protein
MAELLPALVDAGAVRAVYRTAQIDLSEFEFTFAVGR